MKTQSGMFKWFAILIIFAIIFEFVLASPSVSAQGEITPTPSATPQPTYTQSAARVDFVEFVNMQGLGANDSYSVEPYFNGFLVNFSINVVCGDNCLDSIQSNL